MTLAALLVILAVTLASPAPVARAEAPPPQPPPVSTPILAPDSHPEPRPGILNATAVQLFAASEAAWAAGDAETLASLVDTTKVRIGIKPGGTPTAAMTRSAAAFLFQDQLRLVKTQSFQITRINVGTTSAAATARWMGEWGSDGMRRLTVTLSAAPAAGRWWLREVRVKR